MDIAKLLRRLPLIVGFSSGTLWTLVYLFLYRLHGMKEMFHREFPFFIYNLSGLHRYVYFNGIGIFAAFLDGLLMGFIIGYLVRLILGQLF